MYIIHNGYILNDFHQIKKAQIKKLESQFTTNCFTKNNSKISAYQIKIMLMFRSYLQNKSFSVLIEIIFIRCIWNHTICFYVPFNFELKQPSTSKNFSSVFQRTELLKSDCNLAVGALPIKKLETNIFNKTQVIYIINYAH